MKKLLAVLLVAVLAISCIAVLPASAASAASVTVVKGNVTVSDETATGATLSNPDKKEATADIVVDLGGEKVIGKVTVSLEGTATAVAISASMDGKDFYDITAGAGAAIADGVATADFSTRMALKAKYVKATVTFSDETLKVKEIATVAGNADVASFAPNTAFSYLDGDKGDWLEGGYTIGVFTKAGDYDLAKDQDNRLKGAQITVATYDASIKAYKVDSNTVNPWPDGHTGKVTLKDGQILVAIQSQGNINAENADDHASAAAKWLMRGVVPGDYITLNGGALTILPASHKFAADKPDDNKSETPSTNEPSKDNTSKVPTGDNGVVLFAVLGLVACAGVAVAVKTRH